MTANLWKASLSTTSQTELYQLRFELIQFLLAAYNQRWQSCLSEERKQLAHIGRHNGAGLLSN
nr:MAG TPA_asm: hypothetical protein [Bacteriophage sp.]